MPEKSTPFLEYVRDPRGIPPKTLAVTIADADFHDFTAAVGALGFTKGTATYEKFLGREVRVSRDVSPGYVRCEDKDGNVLALIDTRTGIVATVTE